ncbi:hypothetical protein ACOSQ2_014565 [Xanthoceras sorbifolium]
MKRKFSLLAFLIIFQVALADLRVGFYSSTCPRAESIIVEVVRRRFTTDKSITAALLRMHFHDCFVRGCDASILLDSTSQKQSEKDAGPNLTVRGYVLIDEAKKALEAACPSAVSCADIITLATRDAARDGLESNIDEVDLPGPTLTVPEALQSFTSKGLNLNDMVTLLGDHTVGVAHCSFFQDRLSDFQGSGAPDSSMDPTLVAKLRRMCGTPSNTNDPTTFLDQNTSFAFDNEYYNQIRLKRGILQIDQELASDKSTAGIVSGFASNPGGFQRSFANAMIKLGSIQVLIGNVGQIRQNCRVVNQGKPQQPTNPSKPQQPSNPGKPHKPNNTGKPQKPSNPGKPKKPSTPGKTKNQASKQKPIRGGKKQNPRFF